jgi:hypothetical protein
LLTECRHCTMNTLQCESSKKRNTFLSQIKDL